MKMLHDSDIIQDITEEAFICRICGLGFRAFTSGFASDIDNHIRQIHDMHLILQTEDVFMPEMIFGNKKSGWFWISRQRVMR